MARKLLQEELSELRSDVNSIMETVLDAMQEVCNLSVHDDLMTSGESNLLHYAELADINKLRNLFNVFNEKTDLLKLLDGCTSAKGVEIFNGGPRRRKPGFPFLPKGDPFNDVKRRP